MIVRELIALGSELEEKIVKPGLGIAGKRIDSLDIGWDIFQIHVFSFTICLSVTSIFIKPLLLDGWAGLDWPIVFAVMGASFVGTVALITMARGLFLALRDLQWSRGSSCPDNLGYKSVTVITPLIICPLLALKQALCGIGYFISAIAAIAFKPPGFFRDQMNQAMQAHTQVYIHLLNAVVFPIVNLIEAGKELTSKVSDCCSNSI